MSDIICYECHDETNTPPEDMPQEWSGLCPACAVSHALKGELPGREAAMEYLLTVLAKKVEEGIIGLLRPIPIGEVVDTPMGPMHYSPN